VKAEKALKIAVDLHIHSALSPCAHDDMTPNNIVNMAILKGLDAIAITDHNSCDNVRAAMMVAGSRLVILPGMEVQSREEAHLLCYFADLAALDEFDSVVRHCLHAPANEPGRFGRQLIINDQDEVIGERNELLISSIGLSLDEIVGEVRRLNGVVVPAHVDRPSYSILSQLGFIPPELAFNMLELSKNSARISSHDSKTSYIFSSDAHCLEDILERESFLLVDDLSVHSIIKSMSK